MPIRFENLKQAFDLACALEFKTQHNPNIAEIITQLIDKEVSFKIFPHQPRTANDFKFILFLSFSDISVTKKYQKRFNEMYDKLEKHFKKLSEKQHLTKERFKAFQNAKSTAQWWLKETKSFSSADPMLSCVWEKLAIAGLTKEGEPDYKYDPAFELVGLSKKVVDDHLQQVVCDDISFQLDILLKKTSVDKALFLNIKGHLLDNLPKVSLTIDDFIKIKKLSADQASQLRAFTL